jgi:hypothetical protein
LNITLPRDPAPDTEDASQGSDTQDDDRCAHLHALLSHNCSSPGDTLLCAALALQYGKLRKMMFHGAVL